MWRLPIRQALSFWLVIGYPWWEMQEQTSFSPLHSLLKASGQHRRSGIAVVTFFVILSVIVAVFVSLLTG